jgi:hypothetical protein
MAKIPRALDIAGPASQTRGVVNVPVIEASTAGAQALREVGKVAQEFGDRLYKADVDKKVTEADRKTREDLDREFRALETSGDIPPEEIETRYREVSDKIIATHGDLVPKGARAMWTERAKTQWQTEGVLKSRTLTRTRQLEGVRAGIIEESAALRAQVGDLAVEESTFKQNIQSQRNLIGRQVENGVLQKDDAAKLTAELDQWVVADKTARVDQNVTTLVRNGQVAEAEAQFKANYKEIDPAKRVVIERGLEDAKFDNRVVTATDKLWEDAGGDYGKFIKSTADIKDAALRTKVEERGDRMRLMEERAEAEKQDNMEKLMWAHVEGGGKIGNASPSLRASIDPDRLGSIRAYENARDKEDTLGFSAKEIWVLQSSAVRNELETMLPERFVGGYQAWSTRDKQRYEQMTPADQIAINDAVVKRRTQGATANDVDKAYSDLANELKRVAPHNWEIGTKDQKKEATEMLGVLRGYAKEQASTGKSITSDQTRELVARAMSSKGRAGKPADIIFNDIIRQGMEGKVKSGAIDPDTVADIEDAFYRSTGRKPSAQETMALYEKVQGADAGTAEAPY